MEKVEVNMDITKKETGFLYRIIMNQDERDKLLQELPSGNIQNGSILQKFWEGLQV